MPYFFEFDPVNRILQSRFEGRVTDDELRAYCRDFTARITLTDPRAAITDLSPVASFEVSRQTIIDLAAVRPDVQGRDPLRIIIATSPHVFGMARMFEMEGRSAHPNVLVVHTREEASAILAVKEPEVEAHKK